ncbi:MAG: hypothetical protein MHPSP_000548 [Paramarteilia canceri]
MTMFIIIIGLFFLESFSSISTRHFYINQFQDPERHNIISIDWFDCPREYKHDKENTTCIKCENGRTTDQVISPYSHWGCDYCRDGWKNLASYLGNPICSRCPNDQIAYVDHRRDWYRTCRPHNCNEYQFFDLEKKTCIECSEVMTNSTGRGSEPETMALKYNCKCPAGQLKVYKHNMKKEHQLLCLDKNDTDKDVVIAHSAIKRAVASQSSPYEYYHLRYVIWNDRIFFRNCNSTEERNFDEFVCLCEKNYVYEDGARVPSAGIN